MFQGNAERLDGLVVPDHRLGLLEFAALDICLADLNGLAVGGVGPVDSLEGQICGSNRCVGLYHPAAQLEIVCANGGLKRIRPTDDPLE
jgi:hypothetical protein